MTTNEERLRDHDKSIHLMKEASGDNAGAFDYLFMIARITRVLDDVFDADREVSREDHLEILEYLFITLPTNSFYATNQDVLLSQHISMFNAWAAANKWEQGDELERIYAHVWRDTVHEVFPIVALLTQGHTQMRKVSDMVRTTFKKNLGE